MYHGKLIHICTSCGNTATVNNKSFQFSTLINCSMCIQNTKKTCEKCSNVIACNDILALDTKTGMFRKADICQACTSIYCQKQPILL